MDVTLATEDNDNHGRNEHGSGQEVSRPETNVLFQFSGSDSRETTNVDTPVEHVENLLVGGTGRNNDTLARLEGLDIRNLGTVLFSDKGRDVGLDTTSTQTDDDQSDDETRERSTRVNGRRNGSAGHDQKTSNVDASEEQDSAVLSKVLISDNGTNDRGNVAPELEKGIKSSSSLLTTAKSTRRIGRV